MTRQQIRKDEGMWRLSFWGGERWEIMNLVVDELADDDGDDDDVDDMIYYKIEGKHDNHDETIWWLTCRGHKSYGYSITVQRQVTGY